MEQEIEKLKKAYLEVEAPVELDFYGFEDVLDRINNKRKNSFYIYRYAGLTLVVLVMLSGVAGITFASKPNSALYPLKIAAQKAIADVTHTSPKHVEDTIDNFISPKKVTPTVAPIIIQSAPTPSVTPKVSETKRVETEKEDEERTQLTGQQKQEERNEGEVKDVSTTKDPEKKEGNSNSSSPQQNENRSGEHRQDQSNNTSSNSHNNSSEHEKD